METIALLLTSHLAAIIFYYTVSRNITAADSWRNPFTSRTHTYVSQVFRVTDSFLQQKYFLYFTVFPTGAGETFIMLVVNINQQFKY